MVGRGMLEAVTAAHVGSATCRHVLVCLVCVEPLPKCRHADMPACLVCPLPPRQVPGAVPAAAADGRGRQLPLHPVRLAAQGGHASEQVPQED
eukprot:365697-Chlamydomonas_euryale.AAC.5